MKIYCKIKDKVVLLDNIKQHQIDIQTSYMLQIFMYSDYIVTDKCQVLKQRCIDYMANPLLLAVINGSALAEYYIDFDEINSCDYKNIIDKIFA